MKSKLGTVLLIMAILVFSIGIIGTSIAATTADITISGQITNVEISDNATTYDFGLQATSDTISTNIAIVAITNYSNTQTDMTASTNDTAWRSGAGGETPWTHDNTATAGADTVGLKAGKTGGAVSDVIVKSAAPNFIYENCPALTSFTYGLQWKTPTSSTDSDSKSIKVVITAAEG